VESDNPALLPWNRSTASSFRSRQFVTAEQVTMSVNLSTNTDELIVIINEKLLAIGSEVRVDEWFSIARSVL